MILIEAHHKKLKKTDLKSLAKFVVDQNFNHHLNVAMSPTYQSDVLSLFEEEASFLSSSDIFIAKEHSNNIVGSIRVLKWDYLNVLPIEKIFSIDPLWFSNQVKTHDTYHIGRFAIKKDLRNLNLLKKLLLHAIEPVCSHPLNIAFAECDSKLLRTLTLLGIKTTIIGKSINYLGSETLPILMKTSGLSSFYQKNKHLIQKGLNLQMTSKSTYIVPIQLAQSAIVSLQK